MQSQMKSIARQLWEKLSAMSFAETTFDESRADHVRIHASYGHMNTTAAVVVFDYIPGTTPVPSRGEPGTGSVNVSVSFGGYATRTPQEAYGEADIRIERLDMGAHGPFGAEARLKHSLKFVIEALGQSLAIVDNQTDDIHRADDAESEKKRLLKRSMFQKIVERC